MQKIYGHYAYNHQNLNEFFSDEMKRHLSELNRIADSTNEPREGSIFYQNYRIDPSSLRDRPITGDREYKEKRADFYDCLIGKAHLLEIGANACHSALLALMANENIRYTGIDIGIHKYTSLCADYMRENFAGRFDLLLGSSLDVVPNLDYAELFSTADIVHIDGAHDLETATADLTNVISLPNKTGCTRHILFDDTDAQHLRDLVVRHINMGLVASENYCGTKRGTRNLLVRVL